MAELPTQRDFEDFSAWTGRDVTAPDGERLGAVETIFLDEATDRPEWVLVRLEDADSASFVPLAGATVEKRSIRVEQDRERIAAAPRLEVEDTLTVSECRRLYEHYGLAYSQEESPTVLPEGAGAQQSGDSAEERPRLRKYVGAPVPPSEGSADSDGDAEATTEQPATTTGARDELRDSTTDGDQVSGAEPAADMPVTKGTGPAEPVPSATAPPAPISPPSPRPIPPEGGFQAQAEGGGESGGRLAVLKRRPALPIALAGGIAGLIALLAFRRRR